MFLFHDPINYNYFVHHLAHCPSTRPCTDAGPFVPKSESSIYGTFALGNENVMELSLPGAKIPWNFRSQERKHGATFIPESKKVVELSLSI